MIDGIKSVHPYLSSGTWEAVPSLGFVVTVDQETGVLTGRGSFAVHNGLRFEARPSTLRAGTMTYCLNGSLHKFRNCGEHNADLFTFPALVDTIRVLERDFSMQPDRAILHGLEIGVNIRLPFSPLRILKQVICYVNKPFTPIDRRNKRLGLVCVLCEYDVKLYDKGAQSGMKTGYMLRFEVKVKRMRFVRSYGIETMADLTNQRKVYPLLGMLYDVLHGIVFMDLTLHKRPLNAHEYRQFLIMSNPIGWAQMSKFQLSRNRTRAETLMRVHSRRQVKPLLFSLLSETWGILFGLSPEAENLQPFHSIGPQTEVCQPATFSRLEYKGKKVAGSDVGPLTNISAQSGCETSTVRLCRTCRRDISNQHPSSKFCSERLFGSAGKVCRNVDSNRRRDYKRQISKAMNNQQFIAITYRVGDETFTDTLHPSEIETARNWLDRITRIDLLPITKGDRFETISGAKAKQFIKNQIKTNEKTN